MAGHIEKVADAVDVDLLQHGDVVQELFGDGRDAEVDDVKLLLTDEVKQQVERSAEVVELDAEVRHGKGRMRPRVFWIAAADCSRCVGNRGAWCDVRNVD